MVKKKFHSLYLLALLGMLPMILHGQRAKKFKLPQKTTSAIQLHSGPSFLLGDLGGAEGSRQDGLGDLDPQSTRFALGTGMIFRQNQIVGARVDLNYALLHGSDGFSEEYYRNKRNISVNTHLFELNTLFNFRLPISQTLNGKDEINLSFGPGLLYFNPTARFEGRSYNLRRLGTEGQRLDADVPEYGPFTFIIPIIFGYHHTFYNTWSLGIELQARKTFTDYLDDVSTVYYDNDVLRSQSGDASAALADPNIDGVPRRAGTQRGNSTQFDNYFFIGLTYRLILTNGSLF